MKRTRKHFFPVILIPAGVFSLILLILLVRSAQPYRRISRFVTKNEAALTEIAEEVLKGKIYSETEYRGVEVEGLFEGDHPMVQFYSFGTGLVPSSTYYGFYYSPEDVPLPYQNADDHYAVTGNPENAKPGTTSYQGYGDNGGRTIRIMPCWFYYEAWF